MFITALESMVLMVLDWKAWMFIAKMQKMGFRRWMVGKTCFHLQEGSSSERERHLCSPISSCNEPEMNYIKRLNGFRNGWGKWFCDEGARTWIKKVWQNG